MPAVEKTNSSAPPLNYAFINKARGYTRSAEAGKMINTY
jgi:hypothetical protein